MTQFRKLAKRWKVRCLGHKTEEDDQIRTTKEMSVRTSIFQLNFRKLCNFLLFALETTRLV